MPKKLIKKIEKTEIATGKTPKTAKKIAYATANKQGLLDKKKKPSHKRKV